MKNIILVALALVVSVVIVGCNGVSSNGINQPVGGKTSVVSKGQTYELSYDIKKTLDQAEPIDWGCKCKIDMDLTVDGVEYTIFGNCGSQKGNQLIQRGKDYYLISEKLKITKNNPSKSPKSKR